MAEQKVTADEEKKTKKVGLIAGIVAAVVVILVAIVVVALNATPKIIGKYEIASVTQNGQESSGFVNFIKSFGYTYTVEFKKDKTGELIMSAGASSSTQTFTYTNKEIIVKNEETGEEIKKTYTYNPKDDSVTIESDDYVEKYTRIKE